ncbi:hypothetical protein ACHAWF_002067 [Thalassiosira exigua]
MNPKVLGSAIWAGALFTLLMLDVVLAFTCIAITVRSAPGNALARIQTQERYAVPAFNWFFQRNDEGTENEASKESKGGAVTEEGMMQRTAKMMEDHRRSQEAAERTAIMMDELSSVVVVGRSKAGASGGIAIGGENRRGGVKVSFNGKQQPIGVEVDPNFLFSSSNSESRGVISIEELNGAIYDAIQDGYQQSGLLMEEKMKGLYSQLGLPRETQQLPSDQDDKQQ